MHTNEIHAPYDRHHKVSPSPNPHHKASNSAKHEDIWKLQLILCNMKYPRSQLCAFLDISGADNSYLDLDYSAYYKNRI